MTTELVTVEQAAPLTLFGTDDPHAIVTSATAKADALAGVIRSKGLAVSISNREYVRVEGWTLLGSMLGVFPVCEWSRPIEDGWEARVEARTMAGQVVGAAEAQCCRSERTWAQRDDYALRSMAQTRATAKALRLPLGFVMSLAGYEATPLEEMPHDAIEGEVVRPSTQQATAPQPRSGAVVCRFCSGPTYDNTKDKRSDASPDYKCKDVKCGGVAWINDDDSLHWKK